jgi:hypothetical protein
MRPAGRTRQVSKPAIGRSVSASALWAVALRAVIRKKQSCRREPHVRILQLRLSDQRHSVRH